MYFLLVFITCNWWSRKFSSLLPWCIYCVHLRKMFISKHYCLLRNANAGFLPVMSPDPNTTLGTYNWLSETNGAEQECPSPFAVSDTSGQLNWAMVSVSLTARLVCCWRPCFTSLDIKQVAHIGDEEQDFLLAAHHLQDHLLHEAQQATMLPTFN